MPGANFPRIKVWAPTGEDVLTTDLNNEFDNILNNMNPAGLAGDSSTLIEMRTEVNPGGVGTESQATSTKGEIERIRFAIRRAIGSTYWYEAPAISLSEANILLNQVVALPPSRIASGKTRSTTDAFPMHLRAHGTAATVSLQAATTNFIVRIDGTAYTFTADTTSATLSTAPAINNTCLVNDAALTAQADSKYAGETDSPFPIINIDTVGTEISALVGKFAAFKKGSEYFIAHVKSATELTKAFRGFFFDNLDVPVVRETLSDNDTITLVRLTWIFANTSLLIEPAYSNLSYSFDTPAAPLPGDFWFDLNARSWKKFNGGLFVTAGATLIGICVQDTTGCKASRSFEAFAAFADTNTIHVEQASTNILKAYGKGQQISVNGKNQSYAQTLPTWLMPTDLESGVVEAINTRYYAYVTENGDTVLAFERPYGRSDDLLGRYHPYHLWRAVAEVNNNGASDFDATTLFGYGALIPSEMSARTFGARVGLNGVAISATTGTYSSTAVVYTDVTPLSITLSTNKNPVRIALISANSGTPAYMSSNTAAAAADAVLDFAILRNSGGGFIIVAEFEMRQRNSGGGVNNTRQQLPPSVIEHLDFPGAGTHTYKLQARTNIVTTIITIESVKIIAYEL